VFAADAICSLGERRGGFRRYLPAPVRDGGAAMGGGGFWFVVAA
jgi:hypothetical protein